MKVEMNPQHLMTPVRSNSMQEQKTDFKAKCNQNSSGTAMSFSLLGLQNTGEPTTIKKLQPQRVDSTTSEFKIPAIPNLPKQEP